MGYAEREREQEPRCRTIQSQAERRDRGQTEKSWRLFEGIDTFMYDLMRKSKGKMPTCLPLSVQPPGASSFSMPLSPLSV